MDDYEIKTLVDSITEGYNKDFKRGFHPERLPRRDETRQIVTLLRRLLFPGYFDGSAAKNTETRVRDLVIESEHRLRRQIALALSMENDSDDNYGDAGVVCKKFFKKLPELHSTLMTDVHATFDGDPAARNIHEIIFAYPGIFAITVYRLANVLHLLSVPLIPRMMTEYAHSLTGIEIHPGAEIDSHFCIDHGTGIVIGETTKIGSRAKIYQCVTLGALSTRGGQNLREVKRHPTLEDDVTVYSGATILGGETVIGCGSVIGGNAFITQSVPPHTSVSMKNPELDYRRRKPKE